MRIQIFCQLLQCGFIPWQGAIKKSFRPYFWCGHVSGSDKSLKQHVIWWQQTPWNIRTCKSSLILSWSRWMYEVDDTSPRAVVEHNGVSEVCTWFEISDGHIQLRSNAMSSESIYDDLSPRWGWSLPISFDTAQCGVWLQWLPRLAYWELSFKFWVLRHKDKLVYF